VAASGTYIRNVTNGWIGEVLGGDLVGLTGSDCAALNCGGAAINTGPDAIGSYTSSHPVAASGTYIRNVTNGWIGEMVGGDLLGLKGSDCSLLVCATQVVNSGPNAIEYLQRRRSTIADRQFVRVPSSDSSTLNFRAAGGTLLNLRSCPAVGSCQPQVTITGSMASRYRELHATPRNGTVLEGMPSKTYWLIRKGRRSQCEASSKAIAVDDSTLASIPKS
jgi:hypothetical protein